MRCVQFLITVESGYNTSRLQRQIFCATDEILTVNHNILWGG